MSDILQAMKADFLSKKNRHVEVPEWNNAKIYYDPLTAIERVNINKGVGSDDESTLMINLLLFKAMNEDRTPMFTDDADTRAIFHGGSDFTVIARVAAEMGVAKKGQDTVDEAKNGSGATP